MLVDDAAPVVLVADVVSDSVAVDLGELSSSTAVLLGLQVAAEAVKNQFALPYPRWKPPEP